MNGLKKMKKTIEKKPLKQGKNKVIENEDQKQTTLSFARSRSTTSVETNTYCNMNEFDITKHGEYILNTDFLIYVFIHGIVYLTFF